MNTGRVARQQHPTLFSAFGLVSPRSGSQSQLAGGKLVLREMPIADAKQQTTTAKRLKID
jgi:hypothetical protein